MMSNRRTKTNHLRRSGGALLIAAATAFGMTTIDGSGQKPSGTARTSAAANRKPAVAINRTVPRVSPPPSRPVFSEVPTERELRAARVFPEPLIPLGTSSPAENTALAAAITRYASAGRLFDVAPFTEFLQQQPSSVWRASLQASLGGLHRASGYYTRALRAWDEAWTLSKDDTSVAGRAVADLTAGQALDMLASMGRVGGLDRWLERTKDRPIAGPAAAKAERAREVRALIAKRPERVIPSGPKAIEILLAWQAKTVTPLLAPVLASYQAKAAGTSLAELRTLASKAGLSMKMVRREAGAPLVTPAIVHLGFDHFSAVLEERAGAFLVRDPALGGEVWMTREALDEEMSGAALISATRDAPGWHELSEAEAEQIVGHSCPPGLPDPDECPCPIDQPGMPAYTLHPVQASVLLSDTPLGYLPPRGPFVALQLRYNHREENQPQTFSFANLGTRWTANWLSYAEEVPFTWFGEDVLKFAIPQHVAVHAPGGGVERFKDSGTGTFTRHYKSAAVLVKIADNPLTFERRHPDGSKEVYGVPDGGTVGTRRSFLSSIVDAYGQTLTFTWDASLRLVAITDALGQVTTLQYADGDPLKITSVTDPFGRIARLTYDGAGHLSSVTDVVNLRSSFSYGNADFIYAMQTPYGVTAFRTPQIAGENARAVEATDPLGAIERVEFWWQGAPVPATVPAGDVPPGFESRNSELNTITSLHWNKGRNTGNVQEAVVWRWLIHSMDYFWDPGWSVSVPHSIQRPGEARTWYDYTGVTARPSKTARKLPDGTVFEVNATYNAQDNVTWHRDPAGRELTLTYAPNGIDLQEIRNTTAGHNDRLASYADYTSGHLPQTVTDAAGQITRLTYNGAGQTQTVTNAKQETTTYSYAPDGYLQSVQGPIPASSVTYAYDGYGRVRSATLQGDAAESTDYDALNRPIRTTYPDGTFEEITYERLDPLSHRDRLGRITRYSYDAERRLTAVRDASGRTIQQRFFPSAARERVIDGNGNATRWERDPGGRVTREVRADGTTETRYTYDALGRLKTVTDAKQQVTTYTYNLDGTVASVAHTNAEVPTPGVTWTYDAAYARLMATADGTGTTTYTYKPAGQLGAGQLASVDGPSSDDVITYEYDELGRLASRALNGVATTFGYDAIGRLESQVTAGGPIQFTYDAASRRISTIEYPNHQTTTYTYLPAAQERRLQTIHHKYPNGATLSRFDYTYDAVGNVATWRQQADLTAVQWDYNYDPADRLIRAVKYATDLQGAVLQRLAYAYDAAGNRLAEQRDDEVTSWSYDRLNRPQAQQAGGLLRITGTVNEPATVLVQGRPAAVDGAGNFSGGLPVSSGTTRFEIRATDPSGNTASQSYDIDQTGSSRVFHFDANGNLTDDGARQYVWDANNRLVQVKAGTTSLATFAYNGDGIRTLKIASGVTTNYVIDDLSVLQERKSSGEVLSYMQAPWIDAAYGVQDASGASYFVRDHLGSIRQKTDASGVVTASQDYGPWGDPTAGAGAAMSFTGRERDSETDLDYYRARYYSSGLGRFISEDPTGFPGGVNFYAYAANSPTNYIDPFGLTEGSPQNVARRKRIADIADSKMGSKEWLQNVRKGTFPAGSYKCNLFVCDVMDEAGAPVRVKIRGGGTRCPLAGELANPNADIPNWRPLKPGEKIEPGDIIAYQYPYSDASGHSGVQGNNGPVTAHTTGPVDGTFPYKPGVPVVGRRYTGQ